MSGSADPWAAFRLPAAPPVAQADEWADFRAPAAPPPVQQWAIDPQTGRPIPGLPRGAPVQSLRSADPSNPVVQSLGRPVGEGAAIAPTAAASLATDREQQRRIYASRLFPDLPPAEALGRVTYGPDGRIMAVGQNGLPFYVEPRSPSMSDPSTLAPGNLASWAASGAGAALPMAGGIAGGLAAAPTSLVAGPAAAGAGAAAGDALRQGLARYFDPATALGPRFGQTPINPLQTLGEAGMAAGGQMLGGVINRTMAPNPMRLPEADIRGLTRDPAAYARMEEAQARAAAQGVDLTPGQAGNVPSLVGLEDAATQRPETRDIARGFYTRQGEQMQRAGQNMLADISPNSDKTTAALAFREAAGEVPTTIRQEGNRAARPQYEAAARGGQQMTPDLAALMEAPAVRRAMAQARQTYRNVYRRDAPETPDFNLWDLTKRALDDMERGAQREGNNTLAMGFGSVRNDLTARLDEAYPSYAEARALTAPTQRLARSLEDTATGRTGDLGIDQRARSILGPLFERSNPEYVAQARAAFDRAGRLDEWNQGVRAYIQEAFDRASRSQEGLNAAMLRRQVWGNVDNRAALRAAMTPEQYAGFDRFMRTVEDVARTFPANSLTDLRGRFGRVLDDAGEDAGTRAMRGAGRAVSPGSYMSLGRSIGDFFADRRQSANVVRLVDTIFSPEGVESLKQLALSRPGSQRAVAITLQIMGRAAGTGAQPQQ